MLCFTAQFMLRVFYFLRIFFIFFFPWICHTFCCCLFGLPSPGSFSVERERKKEILSITAYIFHIWLVLSCTHINKLKCVCLWYIYQKIKKKKTKENNTQQEAEKSQPRQTDVILCQYTIENHLRTRQLKYNRLKLDRMHARQ